MAQKEHITYYHYLLYTEKNILLLSLLIIITKQTQTNDHPFKPIIGRKRLSTHKPLKYDKTDTCDKANHIRLIRKIII